ncbi:hypothetical protein E1265_22480 [Streptomyces sp. 8K308]|uniref:hypothetical protein n=1 Tax=Streptomyces sp. 8K308 TaxID=2530388 RepID=UPI001043F12E|nr:hypothetical protein [Streptomyces sp. 8K308]TDC20272.1 hypothetical protein E1265_22480 [Streptomyces sp. 8K308]
MSSADTGGINDPLPRMSRSEAEEWAVHWADSMARTADADIVSDTEMASFHNCVGRDDEVADDGRFFLMYSVRADIAPERRAEAVRAIRDRLEEAGLEIQGFRSDPEVTPANAVDAWHPEDHQSVTAEDNGDAQLLLTVETPCLLPPGVEQQQFG